MAFMLDEILDKINLSECDGGGCACGGDCGGGCGGDAGTGGGISSGDVLGPGGTAENGGGCMGKDDFHVPFPVMPCLFRWPANWVGGSQKKRKKGKKTVSVKNPYTKGMKTIVAEEDGVAAYTGEARKKFDEMTQDADNVFTGVLTFNRKWKLAWVVNDDGIMEFYKPIQDWNRKTHSALPDGKWRIYHTKLAPDGMIQLIDVSGAEYESEETALTAVWNEVKRHKQKLAECLKSAREG